MDEPKVSRFGGLDMQVCVPESWSDDQAHDFAESKYPCGTEFGWHIRKQGSPFLKGAPERNACAERAGYVHITFDA